MQQQHTLPYLQETLLFLVLAGILIPLLQRFRINQVLGFLAVGVLVGPFGLTLWVDQVPWLKYLTLVHLEGVNSLAEFGVLFLMFMIGLELSAERLWSLRNWVFGAGTVQVFVSAGIIGGIAYLFGNRIEVALVLGFALSLSSTAVVMQLLAEKRSLASPVGQAGFSILMLQDLAVVPLFIMVGLLGSSQEVELLPLIGLTLAKSIGAVGLIYFLGRRVIRPMFHSFAKQRQPDVFMALTLLSTLGIGALTAAAGLSMALGALLAGLLLAETEFRHEVEVTIEPFKGLLMGLFFLSVGMQVDAREIALSPLWIPLSVVGLFAIKTLVVGALLRIGGLSLGKAFEGGLLLGQGGEFAFIVITSAMANQLFDPATGKFVLIVVAISMFVTPLAARAGQLAGAWWDRQGTRSGKPGDIVPLPAIGHVVVAGYGRVGQLVAEVLRQQNVPCIALENDARVLARLHKKGTQVFFGDASRAELLEKIDVGRAAAIILTMDHPASTLHAVKAIRRAYPDMPLFARSRDEKHALALKKAGATEVIPETLETGLQLIGLALQSLGLDKGDAHSIVHDERQRRITALQNGSQE